MKSICRFPVPLAAALLLGSCDVIGTDSGLFLGGADRRLSDPPEVVKPADGRASDSEQRIQATSEPVGPASADGTISAGESVIGDATGIRPRPPDFEYRTFGSGRFVRQVRPRTRQPVSLRNGSVTLNFVDADVREVVKMVMGDTLQLNFAVDPSVNGTITLQTSRPVPRGEVLSVLESALRLNGLALVRNGSFYIVVPAAAAVAKSGHPRIAGLGPSPDAGFGAEIMPLEFASATEIAKVLQPLVPSDAILRTDAARNMLIVSGTLQERQTIADIVSIFDVDWLAGMSFAVSPLNFATAEEMILDLERIFGAAKGGPLDGALRFFPIQRKNAVLVLSTQPDYIGKVQSWIRKLDVGGSDQQRLYVYPVENARAVDLAATLSQVFSGSPAAPQISSGTTVPGRKRARLSTPGNPRASGTTASRSGPTNAVSAQAASPLLYGGQATPLPVDARGPGASSPGGEGGDQGGEAAVAALSDQMSARIIADDTNNSLVVMATPRVWRMIEDALRRLDVVPVQVMIEATIAEVTLNEELRYGVQSFFRSGSSSITFSTGASAAINSTFPGFSYVFQNTDNDIKVVLDALDSVTDIRVISSPQVLVVDNRTAELQVGDQVPVSTQQSVSNTDPDAPTINQIELRDTGVVLRVTPRVNASGVVNLDIEQEESSAVQTTSSGIDSPTIQRRKLRSTVIVNSGETVALGGLIRDTKTDGVSGIPLLSSIPVVGNLFSSTSTTGRRTELLVLIKPRVIRNPDEARKVTRELRETLRNAAGLYRKPDAKPP